jgi:outer membrane receptor protein involved in Fe transport
MHQAFNGLVAPGARVRLRTALAAATALTILASAGPVRAQDTTQQAADPAAATGNSDRRAPASAPVVDPADGLIVVTGSRAALNGFSAPSPTVVVSREIIAQQSAATIAEVLYQDPAYRATKAPSSNGINFSNPGQATADLRALGPQRTLVLVNGSRVVPSASSVNAGVPVTTDLNLIPTLMIDRVETVTGGASAQYGSDAVSGVVNILLRRKVQGVELTGQAGISERGDNFNWRIGGIGGLAFGEERGHVVVSAEYNKNKGVGDIYTRDWGRQEYMIVSNAAFATNGMPANIVAPNVHNNIGAAGVILSGVPGLTNFTFNADKTTRPFNSGTLNNGTFQIGGEGQTATVGIDLVPPVRRLTTYGRAQYELSDAAIVILEGGYAESHGTLNGAIARFNSATIRRDNAFLPAAVRNLLPANGTFQLSKTFYNFGNAHFVAVNKSPHVTFGLEGKFGGNWSYDAHYSWGENKFRNDVTNNLITARQNFALDAVDQGLLQNGTANGNIVCRATLPGATFNAAAAGCAPLDPFGPTSGSAAAQAYVNGSGTSTSVYKQNSAAFNVRGEPFSTWAGPVAFAFGGEYRKESQVVKADSISGTGGFALVANVGPFAGKFDVTEGYVETIIPLAKDVGFAKSLDINGAIRYADYSTVGGQTSWKVGAVYEPIDGIRLRTTRSRDIRAPAIWELNGPGSNIVIPITVRGVFARIPQNTTVGNPNLKPERGDTFTVGAVVEPPSLRGFRASLDYFNIKLSDVITSLAGSTIGNLCTLGEQQFCNYITFAGTTPVALAAPQLNLAKQQTKGLDGVLSYTLPLGTGSSSLNLSLSGTYVFHSYLNSGSAGSTRIDRAGENGQGNSNAVPTFRGNGSLTYRSDLFSLTGQLQYLSKGKIDNTYNTTPALSINDNHVPAVVYVNAYSTVHVTNKIEITFSIRNLFDKDPPPAPYTVYLTPVNGIYYDKIGRSFQGGVNLKF